MQEIRRNLLYEVKKESNKRADPFFAPNSEDDDLRAENQRLRTKIRSQDTEIIRLNGRIEQLTQQITFSTIKYNTENTQRESNLKQAVSQFSKVPMILENKQLKESNEVLNREILAMNGHNNQLQAELRKIKSQKYGLEMRIKEFNILEKMREERFKNQVDKLTPIFIQEPKDFSILKNAITHLTKFIRATTVEVMENLFLVGIKECQGNKKLNSFTVFNNYWKQLVSRKSYGYAAAVSCYRSLRKVMLIVDEGYASADLEQSKFNQTIDEWVVNSIIEMRTQPEPERRLFRLLALKYRCKFPIKGEKWEMTDKVKTHLEDTICQQAIRMLLPTKEQNIQDAYNSEAVHK